MPADFKYDVFLSHNSADKPQVRRLVERLRTAGLRVWFDDLIIQPGDDIYLAIERGLEVSRTLVLCLSPAALGSGWVDLERSTVLFRDPANAGRRFIPLLLSPCDLPDVLRRFRYIDYSQENNAAFETLLTACLPGPGRVSMATITTSVRRSGTRYRFSVRLEGKNESHRVLGWSGLTINIPTIKSVEMIAQTNRVTQSSCPKIYTYPQGELLWGFLPDGSWGRKPAEYLMVESVAETWHPSDQMSFEVTMEVPWPRLDLLLRAWADRPNRNSEERAFGDPEWGSLLPRDQQGIPAYRQSIGLE